MSAHRTSPEVKRAPTTQRDRPSTTAGTEAGGPGGGANRGIAYALGEIDPDTLPEPDPWDEVRRRIAAWRAGRDGWRTGEIATELDDFGGDGR